MATAQESISCAPRKANGREGDEDEEQVVDGDADGVADEYAQPLVAGGDAADEEVVDLGVDRAR